MFQKKLLQLLDNFGVKCVRDYHKLPPGDKPYFIRRLYKVFVSNSQDIVSDLTKSGGVKFHFAASGNLEDPNPNVPSELLLRKMSFYANRVLVTFPFQEIKDQKQLRALRDKPKHTWNSKSVRRTYPMIFGEIYTGRDGYGGWVGLNDEKAYYIDPAAFDDMLTTCFRLRPAINAGFAYLIPHFPDNKRLSKPRKLGLTSANFTLKDLQTQFNEQNFNLADKKRQNSGLTYLLLPHFTNVPFERVLEIRAKEEELYWEFQRRLEHLLYEADQLESEQILMEFLREVDRGVRELQRKFTDIQEIYRRKSIYMLIKFICASLVLLSPVEAREVISGILGSMTVFDFFTLHEQKAKEIYQLRSNRFYLPWLIFKA
jgi:hypothetical protein